MSLVFDAGRGADPSTHVLAIGVGRYPYLLGGDKKLAAKPLGLKQLESPPISLKALVNWFLAPATVPGNAGFTNTLAPLGTLRALASARDAVVVDTPKGAVTLDPATKDNIDSAFAAWLDEVKRNDANIGVFYFCGHGMMVSDHYLLAEDFGSSNLLAWSKAFDVSSTIRGVEREVGGALYVFIDACREVSRDLALSAGANPMALIQADLGKKLARKSLAHISATGEGQLAFAPSGGQVSRFTKALLRALSGYAGIRSAGRPAWEVDGETLGSAARQLLEYEWEKDPNQRASAPQVCEQVIQGCSVPLIQLNAPPRVAVEINYVPETMRAQYRIYVRSMLTEIVQTNENKCLEGEVPMGVYTVGAIDPAGALQADERQDEELRPPRYSLSLGNHP